ncbi:MAG: hypothetical protein ACI8RZ_005776 [Myxococcota bacterium]
MREHPSESIATTLRSPKGELLDKPHQHGFKPSAEEKPRLVRSTRVRIVPGGLDTLEALNDSDSSQDG